jgi:aquaporin Z
MRRYVTELIGAFFLVLTIGLVVPQGTDLAPIAIGSVLMVMVYMGGHVSGGHYNPAVSLAVLLRGQLSATDFAAYSAAQTVGAILAALLAASVTDTAFAVAPADTAGVADVFVLEMLFTFALALVVLNTATARATKGNSFFGLAIGFTVLVGAFAAGPVSGGAFNPAVAAGLSISAAMGGEAAGPVWIYLMATLIGGAIAAAVFRMQEVTEHEPPPAAPRRGVPGT